MFFKSVISLFVVQISNYLIPLLTLPYLTRSLGLDGFGHFGLAISIIQYFVLFTDFGFNLSATKKISQNSNDKTYISLIFFETIILKLTLCSFSLFIILILIKFNLGGIFSTDILYGFVMVIGTAIFPLWFFQGIEKIPYISVMMVLVKLGSIPLFFIFVKHSDNLHAAIFIQAFPNFIVGIISLIHIKNYKLVSSVKFKNLDLLKCLNDSFPIFIATFSISMYTMSTTIIIGLSSNITEVSLFSAADRLKGAILGFFLIMGNVIYPKINKLLTDNKVKAYKLIKYIFIIQNVLSLFIILFVYLFSDLLISIFYGNDFKSAAYILFLLSISIFFVLNSTIFGNYILLTHGFKKLYSILPVISAFIHIPLCFILSKKYGALGGAYSIIMIELITFISLLFIVRKKRLLNCIFSKE